MARRAKEEIHNDISVPAFKSLLKNFKKVRYVIDGEGKLHVGAADNFIHGDIYPYHMSDICGYAMFDGTEFTHRPWYSDKRKRLAHPLFAKFAEKGIKRVRTTYKFIW